MHGRLIREEAGMTMGLTVILVVVIGVMGAGLLAFVQSDLEGVMRFNEGQRALEAADSGLEAARRELLAVPFPESYDGETGARPESGWSSASPPAACGDLAPGSGQCITTAEGDARVAIRYLPPPDAASGAGSARDPGRAPRAAAEGYRYFRVESDGISGGSRRKLQAILEVREEGSVVLWSWRECRSEACL